MIIPLCHVTYHLHRLWRLGCGHLREVTVLVTTRPTRFPHPSPPLLSCYYFPSGASGPCPVRPSTGAVPLDLFSFCSMPERGFCPPHDRASRQLYAEHRLILSQLLVTKGTLELVFCHGAHLCRSLGPPRIHMLKCGCLCRFRPGCPVALFPESRRQSASLQASAGSG